MKRRIRQQKTLCGRPRAWTELVEGLPNMRVRLTYPCGYSRLITVAEDKQWQRIAGPLLVRFVSNYWSKAGGGTSDECPRCRRAALKKEREGATR